MQTTLLEYLQYSVAKFPDKIAFEDESRALSFQEMDKEARIISDAIIARIGYTNNHPVLIFLPKSVSVISSILGILYSGNFYTPTNPSFPEHKIQDILEVLQPKIIVSDNKNTEKLVQYGVEKEKIINLDELDFSLACPQTNENSIIDTDLAYVFFTSGSTGKPKGVAITHRNVIDYVDWACDKFPIDEETVFGNQSAFYFDISTQDVYATLKKSAKLVVIPEQLFAFPVKVVDFIDEKNINFLYWVPSAYVNLSNVKALDSKVLSKIKAMMFGGEVMPTRHLNYLQSKMPNLCWICNVYGPTEATVNITYFVLDREFGEDEMLPLGHIIETKRAFLLDDKNRQITEQNIQGEICAVGTCISPGYYRNPEKTEEVFVQNPLHNDYPEKIYRTGDLAKYDENGLLVFCGRKDNQIKHFGYRIELGEIEAAALSLDFVSNAVGLYHQEKRQIMLLYSSDDSNRGERDVRRALAGILPKYMIPTLYFQLDSFPLNPNGKIDRAKLKKEYVEE